MEVLSRKPKFSSTPGRQVPHVSSRTAHRAVIMVDHCEEFAIKRTFSLGGKSVSVFRDESQTHFAFNRNQAVALRKWMRGVGKALFHAVSRQHHRAWPLYFQACSKFCCPFSRWLSLMRLMRQRILRCSCQLFYDDRYLPTIFPSEVGAVIGESNKQKDKWSFIW